MYKGCVSVVLKLRFWTLVCGTNRPFPSSKNSHFHNESKCKNFLGEISFTCTKIKNHVSPLARRFETEAWPGFQGKLICYNKRKKDDVTEIAHSAFGHNTDSVSLKMANTCDNDNDSVNIEPIHTC